MWFLEHSILLFFFLVFLIVVFRCFILFYYVFSFLSLSHSLSSTFFCCCLFIFCWGSCRRPFYNGHKAAFRIDQTHEPKTYKNRAKQQASTSSHARTHTMHSILTKKNEIKNSTKKIETRNMYLQPREQQLTTQFMHLHGSYGYLEWIKKTEISYSCENSMMRDTNEGWMNASLHCCYKIKIRSGRYFNLSALCRTRSRTHTVILNHPVGHLSSF